MTEAATTAVDPMPDDVLTVTGGEAPAPSLAMHAAAWTVVACGLYAANVTVDEPTFLTVALCAATLGCIASYVSRLRHVPTSATQAVFLCAVLAVCGIAIAGGPVFESLLPVTAADRGSKAIAVFLAWIMVACCFTLVTETWMLFLCVFVVGLMGLSGTAGTGAPLTEAFAIFVFAACFLMVHQGWLGRRWLSHSRSARLTRLGSQALLTVTCLVGALVAGTVIAVPLRAVGGMVAITAGVMPIRPFRTVPLAGTTQFDESRDRAIGTGPVTLGENVVLEVRTKRATYLRGTTLDIYTGRSWRASIGAVEQLSPADERQSADDSNWLSRGYRSAAHTFEIPETATSGTGPQTERVSQAIQMEAGIFNDLYGASEPRQVSVSAFRLGYDVNGGIHLQTPSQGLFYTVVSDVVTADAPELARAGTQYPGEVAARYLDPGPITPRFRATALEVTAGLGDAHSKATALAEWVADRCRYNTNAEAIPSGNDVADYFVFTSREGYCDSFATALTLMCRANGIPARVATGFLPGDFDEYSQKYLVRERHNHMWTEVFFPGHGWVTFDATSGAADVSDQGAKSESRRSGVFGFLFGRGILPPLAMVALLGMIGYVLRVEVLGRRKRRRGVRGGLGLPDNNLLVVATYERACAVVGRRGLPRAAHQTPDEHLRAVRAVLAAHPEAVAALQTITDACVVFRYSGREARDEDVEAARAALQRLRSALREVRGRIGHPIPARAGA